MIISQRGMHAPSTCPFPPVHPVSWIHPTGQGRVTGAEEQRCRDMFPAGLDTWPNEVAINPRRPVKDTRDRYTVCDVSHCADRHQRDKSENPCGNEEHAEMLKPNRQPRPETKTWKANNWAGEANSNGNTCRAERIDKDIVKRPHG
jgi:hypothetical protein